MFTGIDVTKHRRGWAGNHENVPGVAGLVNGGKAAVIHLSRQFFMIDRTYEGKLKAYGVSTL